MGRRRFLLLACAVGALFASMAARAADDGRSTIGPADCLVVNPNPQHDETVAWSGECRDGMADGDGTLDRRSGGKLTEHYVGHLRAGVQEGQGDALNGLLGEHYVGGFHAGFYEGEGVLDMAGGLRLTGHFVHGILEGEGEVAGPGGMHYKGGLHGALPEGSGKSDDGHGNGFEGVFHRGLPAGVGTLTRNGVVIHGDWSGVQLSGVATIDGPGRRHYEGTTAGEQPDGAGTLTLADGEVYRGSFAHGARSGDGTLTTEDGHVRYVGGWKNDVYDGHGRVQWDEDTWYEGELRGGKQGGRGTLHFAWGTMVGEFDPENDAFTGVSNESDGIRVEGRWLHGQCDGTMLLTFADASFHQTFRAGVAEGPWDGRSENAGHFSGSYHEGRPDGPMAAELPDGTRVRGQMRAGLREGGWKVYDRAGVVRDLRYEHDELVEGEPLVAWDPLTPITGCSHDD